MRDSEKSRMNYQVSTADTKRGMRSCAAGLKAHAPEKENGEVRQQVMSGSLGKVPQSIQRSQTLS